jgi:hypothetical protein
MLCAAMVLALGFDPSQAADVGIPMVNVALPKSPDDPASAGSIGFDDLIYDETTKSILLPGGRSGNIYRIDATANDPTASVLATGFVTTKTYSSESHDFGVTSVVALPDGLLVATDRADPDAAGYPGSKAGDANAPTLTVIDPSAPFASRVISKSALGTKPDFIRFVAATDRIWISEPDGGNRMQIFSRPTRSGAVPAKVSEISYGDGPESLSIDAVRALAYSNAGKQTLSVKLADGSMGAVKWDSGCHEPKFIAVDAKRGLAFNACLEGGVVAHDVATGAVVGRLTARQTGGGVDILGYAPGLSHLYVASGLAQKLSIVAVLAHGEGKNRLKILGQASTGGRKNYTSNAVADTLGHVWVPRPLTGDVARFTDPFPATN